MGTEGGLLEFVCECGWKQKEGKDFKIDGETFWRCEVCERLWRFERHESGDVYIMEIEQ